MAKRNAAEASVANYEDHRSKRRRDIADTGSSQGYDSASEESSGDEYGKEGNVDTGKEVVKQVGLNVLNIIKTAKSKDGRVLSTLFLRQPPKRDYPDYYVTIKRPIALNDIQRKILNGRYNTHEAVKADFDLCFENAKTYNITGSDIYTDADTMQQIVAKEYEKLAKEPDDMQVDVEEESGPDQHKKSKGPNLHRLLKTRLAQVMEKTHDDGRLISSMFLELPSKKDWPMYYKTIKRPMALEPIMSKVKRKEYNSSLAFANDVELVFSNAMQFNAEHSEIWNDALTLRDTFRQLMSDLPEPYTISQYQKPPTKIKLKLPAIKPTQAPAPTPTSVAAPAPSPAPEVPVAPPPKVEEPEPVQEVVPVPPTPTPAPPPRVPSPKLPSTSSIKPHKAAGTAAANAKAHTPATPTQAPRTRSEATASMALSAPVANHPPQERSLRSLAAITAALPPAAPLPKATPVKTAPPPPVLPAPHYHYLIKQAMLQTKPRGRIIPLDSHLGVKSWVVYFGNDERSLLLRDVEFVANEEEEESSADEEEHDEDDDAGDAMTNGKKKVKAKRGRGRPAKNAPKIKPVVTKPSNPGKKKAKLGEIQVKLDGKLVAEQDIAKGQWALPLTGGMHIIEFGEKDGMVWKIYAYQQV